VGDLFPDCEDSFGAVLLAGSLGSVGKGENVNFVYELSGGIADVREVAQGAGNVDAFDYPRGG
jgi:hypothetical protein